MNLYGSYINKQNSSISFVLYDKLKHIDFLQNHLDEISDNTFGIKNETPLKLRRIWIKILYDTIY